MLYSFKIASRYLTANRAQTALLIFGVAVGVYVFVFMSALIGGLAVLLLDRTVGNLAHVTVEAADRDPVSLFPTGDGTLVAVLKSTTQRTTLQSADAFAPLIAAVPRVTIVVGEILGNGFIAKGESVSPVAITGVVPDQISKIANIEGSLVAGSADLTISSVLLGAGLADTLGVRVGQTVTIRSERDVAETLTVAGIFSLGVAGLDDAAAYVNQRVARVLFDLPAGLTRFEIKLDDLQQAPQVATAIAAATGLKATPWTDKNKELLDALVAQARTGDLIKVFALITIIIGVASALLLSTYRRQSEIGIMRAMGATRRFVVLVFVIQGALVGLSGGLLGAGVGYLSLLPFPIPQATAAAGLPVDIRQGAYLTAIVLTLIGAIVASIWPANAASKVDPVTVIGP